MDLFHNLRLFLIVTGSFALQLAIYQFAPLEILFNTSRLCP